MPPSHAATPRHTDAPDLFSSQVMLALSALSSRFGNEINGAFQTMPATEERAKENVTLLNDSNAAMDKLKVLRGNKQAISEDMQILHQAKVLGNTAQFQGFLRLGKDDYLDHTPRFVVGEDDSDFESVDSDDEEDNDDDKSDDESSEEDDSEEDESDEEDFDNLSDYDDSDYDSDDSSLGSVEGLMTEMENDMGVVIPEDLKVKVFKSKGSTSVLTGTLYWDKADASLISMES